MNTNHRRTTVAGLVGLLMASACDSSSGTGGSGGGGLPPCEANLCDNDGGVNVFTACGGDPKGSWAGVSLCWDLQQVSDVGDCPYIGTFNRLQNDLAIDSTNFVRGDAVADLLFQSSSPTCACGQANDKTSASEPAYLRQKPTCCDSANGVTRWAHDSVTNKAVSSKYTVMGDHLLVDAVGEAEYCVKNGELSLHFFLMDQVYTYRSK